MARLPHHLPGFPGDSADAGDSRLVGIMENIEREKPPERLLQLAIELQEQLAMRKQRQNPH